MFTIETADPVVRRAEIRRRNAFEDYGLGSPQYNRAFNRWSDLRRRSRNERREAKRV